MLESDVFCASVAASTIPDTFGEKDLWQLANLVWLADATLEDMSTKINPLNIWLELDILELLQMQI